MNMMRFVRVAILGLIGCLLSACETTATEPSQSVSLSMSAADAALAKELGAICNDSGPYKGCILGNLDAGDFYAIDFTADCGSGGHFANILDAVAPLLDVLPVTGSNAKTVANAASGQLVCIQATAHVKEHVAYYYVADITPEGTRSCTIDDEGELQGECGRGWILAKELKVLKGKP